MQRDTYLDDTPHLLDVRALARMLSISTATVWRLRAANKLPAPIALTSGTVRWRSSDVKTWIEAGCPVQATEMRT